MNSGFNISGLVEIAQPQDFNDWIATQDPELPRPVKGSELFTQECIVSFGPATNFFNPNRLIMTSVSIDPDKFYYPFHYMSDPDMFDRQISHTEQGNSKLRQEARTKLPEVENKIVEALELGFHGATAGNLNYLKVYYRENKK